MRKLIPVSQLSPQYMDSLRETIEIDLKAKAARTKGNQSGDWKVRDLLPWTDLNITSAGQAGVNTDYWGMTTLAVSTLLTYVNHKLDSDEFVAIYGVALPDVNPCVLKLLMQTGGAASTKANYNLEEIYASDVAIGLTPEWIYYRGDETVFIQVMPDAVGKAVGADAISDHLALIGLIATPAGEVISV